VDDGVGVLGVAEQLGQPGDALQPPGRGAGDDVGLEVDAVGEEGERAGKVDGGPLAR
jgi:hypothetical protein